MKKLMIPLVLITATAFGQGVRYDGNNTTSAKNVPPGAQAQVLTLPYSTVKVCGYPAVGDPCTNSMPIYSDVALTQLITQPLASDSQGRFGFWVPAALYSYSITTFGGTPVGTFPLSLNSPPGPGGIGCGAGNCLQTNPTVTQTVTQPINTDLGINTSGVGKLKYNGAEVLSGYGYGKFAYPGINLFGDSITCGNGATGTNTWYATLLSNAFNGVSTNRCRGGDQAADVATVQMYPNLNPSYNSQPATTIMIGINDALECGISAGCQNNYTHSLMSSIAWSAVPNQLKVLMGSNTQVVSTTGAWTADPTLQANLAKQTIVNGSTLTFTTLTPSTSIYVSWMGKDGDTASGALSCDSGAVTDTLNAFGYNGHTIATLNGTTTVPFANRYTFAANTTHTCTITATASAGNPFSLVWAGSPQSSAINSLAYPTANPPRVFVGGVTRQQAGAGDAATAIFDGLAQTVANQLASDGLHIAFVDTRSAVNVTTDFSGGTLANQTTCPASTLNPRHPGDCGHQHIADAFLALAQPIAAAFAIPPQLTLNVPAAGPDASITLANTTSNSRLSNKQLYLPLTGIVSWSNNPSSISSITTGISECGFAGICIGNGTYQDATGNIQLADVTASDKVTATVWVAASNTSTNNVLTPSQLQLSIAAPIAWSNAASSLGTKVTGLSQVTAGVVGVGNGTQGDTSGAIVAAYYRPSLTTAPVAGTSCVAFPNGTLALGLDGKAASCVAGLWTARW